MKKLLLIIFFSGSLDSFSQPNAVAHARMGYVVIDGLKEVVYLDCNKRALKKPAKGWLFEIVDPNYKKQ